MTAVAGPVNHTSRRSAELTIPNLQQTKQLLNIHELQQQITKTADDQQQKTEDSQYASVLELYEEIRQFFTEYLDLPNDVFYDILTAWTLTTWRTSQMNECAYLLFRGKHATGKSRALELLEAICYKPCLASCISKSAIYRQIDQHGLTTFLLDEFDQYNKEKRDVLLSILNAGYRKTGKAVVVDPNDKNKVKEYPCFGPKAISMIKEVQGAFHSRCIHIPMMRNIKRVPCIIEDPAKLRLKLNLYKEKTKDTPLEKCYDMLYEAGVKHGRHIELFNALVAVTPTEKRETIIEYAKELYQDLLDEDQASLFKEIYNAIKHALTITDFPGKISIQDVADHLNQTRQDNQISNRLVGSLLTTIGLNKKCNYIHNKRGRKITARIIERLDKIYGDPQQTLKEEG